MGLALYTSTEKEITILGEDNVLSRHHISRVRKEAVPYMAGFNFSKDIRIPAKQDIQIQLSSKFMEDLQRVIEHVGASNDYALRRVTIAYVPAENSVYLLGGKTSIQSCFKCKVENMFGSLPEGFALQIGFDDLIEYLQAVKTEFHTVGLSILTKAPFKKLIFIGRSEDKNAMVMSDSASHRSSSERFYMFAAPTLEKSNVEAAFSIFEQYGEEGEWPVQYRIFIDNKLKSLFANKPNTLHLVQRKGLLSLKVLSGRDSDRALEVYSASPVMVVGEIGIPKEGEVFAAVDGKALYEAIALHQDQAFTINVLGKVEKDEKGEMVLNSPCIRIDGEDVQVLISQDIKITVPKTSGFAIKKGKDFVETTEKESLDKAIKTYRVKSELPVENKQETKEDINTAILQALESINKKLDELNINMSRTVEPEIGETPEMATTLQRLPDKYRTKGGTKPGGMAQQVKDYICERLGDIVRVNLMKQEILSSESSLIGYLSKLVEDKRLLRLAEGIYYAPTDFRERINIKPADLPSIDRSKMPEEIRKQYMGEEANEETSGIS